MSLHRLTDGLTRAAGGLLIAALFCAAGVTAAASAEIAVSCGATTQTTNISTSRDLRKLKAVRIVVDPNNNCHIEVALELTQPIVRRQVTPPSTNSEAAAAPAARCFNFAGQRYCE